MKYKLWNLYTTNLLHTPQDIVVLVCGHVVSKVILVL